MRMESQNLIIGLFYTGEALFSVIVKLPNMRNTCVLNSTGHVEPHIKESNHIRDFVFGFGDGINTSLGIVAGVGGANSSADFIILAALVGMFTGAKAMAVQNYLALKSQREILESEIKREEYEMEAYPEKERMEIEEIYRSKDFDEDLVKRVTDKITSNKRVWLKTMLTEELGLNLDIVGNPIKGALIMFASFIIGGILPILPYLLSKTGFVPLQFALWIAIAVSLTSSFLIGAKKAKLAKKNWVKGGIEMSALGTGIALLGYGIGAELNNANLLNY
ncbi:MAG: VIT1/CCC1 transporter family protein [Nitrososphaeraceae archaeon]|nr:VIT1/CCC1 transporter family protein [Nitrososphaeraceae archaeon]